MVGIRSYGAYIPKYRLGKETAGWGQSVEKAVGNFDEDSITMAVAAGMDCLGGQSRDQVSSLFFATTAPPYLEKQGAAVAATALDLKRETFTADVTTTLRAGTTALRLAMDAIASGSARDALVVAGDTRMAAPRSDLDRSLGDGGAALLLSKSDAIAEIEGIHSISEHILDVWRPVGEQFLRSWEERFVTEEGYLRIMSDAVTAALQKYKLTPGNITKAVYTALDPRRHSELGRKLGFSPQQIQDPLFGKVGNTGAAFPLMLLGAALESAKPGDRILLASYGDGADVYILRVTENITKFKGGRGVKRHLESKRTVADFDTYLRWHQLQVSEAPRRPTPPGLSPPALLRERDQNLRLYGVKCTACGRIEYPPQRICTFCKATDKVEFVRLSDKRGEVFTYSMDYLAGAIDTPLVITVVNFNGGGRMLAMMTDRELNEVKIGLPVEMSFRKLQTLGGIHNYHWKSVPVRA
ncbi:MAG: OB-fold domain-containing protein [Chloroflexi bacterium]|nr:OB-fold domain-containing protein [Chloroflexota bacterium]